MFCIITTVMGILLDESYEKSKCIWFPALMHGAINAFAGTPSLFLNTEFHNEPLFGPLMMGLIGGLPMILLAGLICFKSHKELKEDRVSFNTYQSGVQFPPLLHIRSLTF